MACQKNQPPWLPIKVAFEHLPHRSTSIHIVAFHSQTTIGRLKRDISQRVKVRPQFQKCFHKGKELNDDDTIEVLQLNRDAIILIKETKAPGLQEEAEQGVAGVHELSESTEMHEEIIM